MISVKDMSVQQIMELAAALERGNTDIGYAFVQDIVRQLDAVLEDGTHYMFKYPESDDIEGCGSAREAKMLSASEGIQVILVETSTAVVCTNCLA